jgi:hypothetical protein
LEYEAERNTFKEFELQKEVSCKLSLADRMLVCFTGDSGLLLDLKCGNSTFVSHGLVKGRNLAALYVAEDSLAMNQSTQNLLRR